jgi:hypothetical protein
MTIFTKYICGYLRIFCCIIQYVQYLKGCRFCNPPTTTLYVLFICTNIGFRYGKLTRAKPDDVGLSRADNPASGLPSHAGRHNPGIRPSKNLPSYLKSNENGNCETSSLIFVNY